MGGSSVSVTERCHPPTAREPGGFLLNSILSSQKEWENEASYQPEMPQPVGRCPHFKMEGIATLKDLLKAGDWMVKVDLKDGKSSQRVLLSVISTQYQFVSSGNAAAI